MTVARTFSALILILAAAPALAGEQVVRPVAIPELKAVYGQVQARNMVLARARIPGTLTELSVSEGDVVKAGDVIARIQDDKLDFQVKAVDAQLQGLKASLNNARSDLDRARQLLKSGTSTVQRVDQLQTQVDVTENQIRAAEAQRSVLLEQVAQGAVLAPSAGRVLTVPPTRSSVIMAGETVATIGGGGFFLRLSIPERHATALKQGAAIAIAAGERHLFGTLAKIYPEVVSGRVTADVEVADLSTDFVGLRVLVTLPVGDRQAILVPAKAVTTRAGLDFVTVSEGGKTVERAVVAGEVIDFSGDRQVEILTGLQEGDRVVTP